jgi:hypothetical protein
MRLRYSGLDDKTMMKRERTLISKKIALEQDVVETMIRLYCSRNHSVNALCEQCCDLLSYAHQRLEHCPYESDKPFCSSCTIHCYASHYKESIRQVMRYSGPRVLFYHPIVALKHSFTSLILFAKSKRWLYTESRKKQSR